MSDDKLNQLERLNRLREAGALSDSEFEDQKQAILVGKSRTGSRRLSVLIGLGIVAAIGAIMLVFFWTQGGSNSGDPRAVASPDAPSQGELAVQVAPSQSPTPEATTSVSAGDRLTFATSDQVIGTNPAYLEQRLGIPRERSAGYLVFELGGCTISYSATGSRVTGFTVDVGPSCSPTIRGNRIGPRTTFGEILNRDNWGQFIADCLYGCGNAADPVIALSYRGSRATNFISIRYSTSYDQASDALSLWEQGVRREAGLSEYESPLDYEPFNCASNPPEDARRLMPRMRVRSISVTGDEVGPC
ncbi:SHOCT domain-containing protein [Tsuneonella troitsensis]|uniref:SHOCT domain-containing protein n=1 Tax=Tsuneonella troitsensis TaxID=292222 RepID=UPI00070F82C8|nr:SHOCT domain-containing protein [Tsuneonella troitsensis]